MSSSSIESVPGADPPVGPVAITDPTLLRLAQIAVPLILQLSQSYDPSQGKIPPFIAWLPPVLSQIMLDLIHPMPSAIPNQLLEEVTPLLGLDWEEIMKTIINTPGIASNAVFIVNVESCLYRMRMAHLLGQLSSANLSVALPLLHRAATLATLQVPQPAYVYALLLSEFTQITIPPVFFASHISPLSSPTLEARKHLERAAFFHFPPAQYKLGHAYEFAEPPFPFDPLLSVQYYSLASERGESEADMALSKWFLCGSNGAAGGPGGVEGGFDKDEALALTFADKASTKGLPSAELTMGYYAEVDVGRP